MSKEEEKVQSVSLNTTLVVAIVCLIAGFLGGIVYNTYKTGTERTEAGIESPARVPQKKVPTLEQTNAILVLEKKVLEAPDDLDSWLQLGNLYFDTGNFQSAITAYRKYIELKPDNPDVWTDLGVMYRRSGQPAEAIVCFDKAVEIDPRHEQSRFNKGIVLLHDLQNPDAALLAWKELVRINPNFITPSGQPIQQLMKNQ